MNRIKREKKKQDKLKKEERKRQISVKDVQVIEQNNENNVWKLKAT